MTGLKARLGRDTVLFTCVAAVAGFSAYFSMYAFRKPFTAATFAPPHGWGFAFDYKTALVIAQVVGYALSKLIGVRAVSELGPKFRGQAIVGLIFLSWVALVLFAVTPAPFNIAALFLNGLPLGLIWGLVFGYMEGRRVSEVLGAVLCASFILSSGVVKSVGALLLALKVPGPWMPAAVGALFAPLLVLSVWILEQLPPPDAADEAARTRRAPMSAGERRSFLLLFGPGVLLLTLAYVLLTALRDFRDNFAADIWAELGYRGEAALFTVTEAPVAVLALGALALVMIVRDNLKALLVIHGVVIAGFLILGLSTLAFEAKLIGAAVWMTLAGAGIYMAYTPFNAMLFDRLVAVSGQVATAGFLIYVADASGYAGSVALLLWRNFGAVGAGWLAFFETSLTATSLIGVVLTAAAGAYFALRRDRPSQVQRAAYP